MNKGGFWMDYKKMEVNNDYLSVVYELYELYKDKNKDYGNSFSILYSKYGILSVIIRLWDKILRLENIYKSDAQVKNETIEDTLRDIANYAIMTLAEIRKYKYNV